MIDHHHTKQLPGFGQWLYVELVTEQAEGRAASIGADLVIDSGMGSDVTLEETNRIAIAPDGRTIAVGSAE